MQTEKIYVQGFENVEIITLVTLVFFFKFMFENNTTMLQLHMDCEERESNGRIRCH